MMTINGRYPHKPSVLHSGNMILESCTPSKDHICIRVDDRNNPDFWIEIGLEREDLEDMLCKMDEAEE